MFLGYTESHHNEYLRNLNIRGKIIRSIFFVSCFLPILVYLLFQFGLVEARPKYNLALEQSVAHVVLPSSEGTAFLVSETRLLTAKHVLGQKQVGDVVDIVFEKALPVISTTARIVWIESSNEAEPEFYLKDVAVLELTDPSSLPENYPYLALGTSDGVSTREPVILIGYPAGLLSTTSGSISNDNVKGLELFQLDVESWPGSSGGPLILEETEEVIGILVAGYGQQYQGINLANKIDNVVELLGQSQVELY